MTDATVAVLTEDEIDGLREGLARACVLANETQEIWGRQPWLALYVRDVGLLLDGLDAARRRVAELEAVLREYIELTDMFDGAMIFRDPVSADYASTRLETAFDVLRATLATPRDAPERGE